MVQSVYRNAPQYKQPAVFAGYFTLPKLLKWTPSLALWGGATAGAVFFFADSITRLRKDVYSNLPLIGSYWDDSVHPEDTPF